MLLRRKASGSPGSLGFVGSGVPLVQSNIEPANGPMASRKNVVLKCSGLDGVLLIWVREGQRLKDLGCGVRVYPSHKSRDIRKAYHNLGPLIGVFVLLWSIRDQASLR